MFFALFSDTSRFGDEGGYQTIGDVFKNGGSYAIVGLLTVFSVLAIIWGVLELFHFISHGKAKKKSEPVTLAVTVAPTSEPTSAVSSPMSQPNDEEIVAVIAAAIAAAQSENPIGSFRVVSFKRK